MGEKKETKKETPPAGKHASEDARIAYLEARLEDAVRVLEALSPGCMD